MLFQLVLVLDLVRIPYVRPDELSRSHQKVHERYLANASHTYDRGKHKQCEAERDRSEIERVVERA